MEPDKKALSAITVFGKYAKFNATLRRRENYTEIIDRNESMHLRKYPQLQDQIKQVYNEFVHTKRVLPSMRSLQFGGRPIELAHSRIYNCAYMPAEDYHFFSELMFLLLGGTGMGYSVQQRHVGKLPAVTSPKSWWKHKYQVQDSIVGWADAIKIVTKAFLAGGSLPTFDYRDIREKGAALITSGGLAPGPEPLKKCVELLTQVFSGAIGRQMTSLEVHDASCIIADAVLAGGIRRAAMICLFDRDDEAMLTCKFPAARKANPHRERANNSAVLLRGHVSKAEFDELLVRIKESGCGEPGFYWTNNLDWGTNPCVEIGLEPYQMCNLTEIHAGEIHTQEEFNEAARAASFLGTLQAGYTDFHYLRPIWRETCERGALLGVSMTGIAANTVTNLNMREAAEHARVQNVITAQAIGINVAERVTCVKPAGTTSLVLGTSSGIHAWHALYYIRRMRFGRTEPLALYIASVAPELVEDDVTNSGQVVISFPQKAPEGACVRTEPMEDLLERVRKVSTEWVAAGHRVGDNRHNVSCTISVHDDAWGNLGDWLWKRQEDYSGISVMPHFDAGAYPQMPFEDCTREQYESMLGCLEGIDIDAVVEENGDAVNLKAELACAAGFCEIT
jgi:ribonucleoside-triphosphate reductase